ncbi:MAG: hypothetical protein EKK55_17320 [Rhodocyclaceae bacterium]|nr:MAG: hypothetical protein EKK55_17320 [Rhodocyclaceae bacterium]
MLNDLVKQVHENAVLKGWWDEKRSPLEIHALIHSEVSEATEAVRGKQEDFYSTYDLAGNKKPEGQSVELVDAVIRIMDYFGERGWNFEEVLKAKMAYNTTRPHRHGGKAY